MNTKVVSRKYNLYFMLCVFFIICFGSIVYGDVVEENIGDIPLGQLYLEGVVPDGLEAKITFKIINEDIDKVIGVSLSYLNGYKASCLTEFGNYKMVLGSAKVTSKDNQVLDCEISIEPFNIGDENPNRDWSYNVPVICTPNNQDNINETVKTELGDAIKDYLTNEKESTTIKQDLVDNVTLIVPADNQYFPNMTLTEIKKWYIEEVNKFIATGLSKKTLKDYQDDVNDWAEAVFDKNEIGKTIEYQVIERYNKEETQEFYLVQKKIYDFIKDYEETHNVYLNFETWEKANELLDLENNSSEMETTSPYREDETSSVESNTTNNVENTETISEVESNVVSDEEESEFIKAIKNAWLTIIICIFIAGGWIVIYFKNKTNKID